MKFSEIQIDERFRFFGRVFTKKGTACAEDEKRSGHVFLGYTEVEKVNEPPLPHEHSRSDPE
jgi:hypothetical protein